ncbi:MAG: hypothetical protein ABI992_12235 [Chthoniobacterales bacterium]
MRALLGLLFVIGTTNVIGASPKSIAVAGEWTLDQKSASWSSKSTGLSLRKQMAGFRQTRAQPAQQGGRASFGYSGPHGVITIIVEHLSAADLAESEDCTPMARAAWLQEMHRDYGRTDSERSFRLQYRSDGRRGHGLGTLCHFLSFPGGGDPPGYSEIGVVLIGEYLLVYRGSFAEQSGLADLNRFVAGLAIKKV